MKKFTIQNITIIVNNQEKVNIICLECKDDKYVLYTEKNINEKNIDDNTFIKFQFNENINITPKKKLTDLFFSINNNNNLHSLLWNNNPVYFLKNTKNIQINDINLKLILSNGVLFNNIKEISLNLDVNKKEKNIIDDILKKNKKMNEPIIKQYDIINKIKDVVEKNNIETNINLKEIKENYITNNIETDIINKEITETDIINKEVVENDIINKEVLENDIINKEVIVNNIETDNNVINKEVVANDISNKEVIINNIETDNNVINKEINGKKIDFIFESSDKEINDSVKNINFTATISNNNIEIKKVDNTNATNNTNYNLEKIKNITNIINEEKIDLDNKKIEIENNVFNLENVLLDFNKLFQSIGENKNISKCHNIDKNKDNTSNTNNIKITKGSHNINLNMNNEINIDKKIKITNLEVKNNNYIHKQYITKIQYLNILYKLNTIRIDKSNELNFLNLYQSKIIDNNIINNPNISFELENINSSYLIIYFNQKYLINKINNTIILTNLFNKKTQIIKNKDNFKLGIYDYMLYNDATLIIPMNNKKIYDNNYGTSFNMYIPKN